jgi:hypothetical protein
MFSSGLVFVVDEFDVSSKSVQMLDSTGETRVRRSLMRAITRQTSAANGCSPGADGTAKILVQRDEAS